VPDDARPPPPYCSADHMLNSSRNIDYADRIGTNDSIVTEPSYRLGAKPGGIDHGGVRSGAVDVVERVHVAPSFREHDRVVEPAVRGRADRIHLLEHDRPGRVEPDYYEDV